MITAKEWLENFLGYFATDNKVKANYGKQLSDKKYTNLMYHLLEDLGEDLGYDVEKEKLRVDRAWFKRNEMEVAIEHENFFREPSDVKSEIEKLISVGAPLRVLITYTDAKFFNQRVKKLSEFIQVELNKIERCSFEFLAVIGTYEWSKAPKDHYWVGYRYYPSMKHEILVVPSYFSGRGHIIVK